MNVNNSNSVQINQINQDFIERVRAKIERLDPRIVQVALIVFGLVGVYEAQKVVKAELVKHPAFAIPLCVAPFLVLCSIMPEQNIFSSLFETQEPVQKNPEIN